MRRFHSVALGGCLVVLGACGKPVPKVIVHFINDDLGSREAEYMPTLMELSNQGVTYTNAYTTAPICGPARAAMMTGKYSHSTGIWGQSYPDGGAPGVVAYTGKTLQEVLREQGWTTAHFGKFNNDFAKLCSGGSCTTPRGWDHFVSFFYEAYYNYSLWIDDGTGNGYVRSYGATEADYSTDVLGKMVLDYIEAHNDPAEKLYIVVSLFAPHGGSGWLQIPQPAVRDQGTFPIDTWQSFVTTNYMLADIDDFPTWLQNYRASASAAFMQSLAPGVKNARIEALQSSDAVLNAIRTTLTAQNRFALDTLVVGMGDNGVADNDHGLTSKGCPYRECTSIPLIFWWGRLGLIPRVRTEMVGIHDLFSTLLDIAGVPPEAVPANDGMNLVPVFTGKKPGRTKLLIEQGGAGGASIAPGFVSCRTATQMYTKLVSGTINEEYYNLADDPDETQNLIPDGLVDPLTLAEMRDCITSQGGTIP